MIRPTPFLTRLILAGTIVPALMCAPVQGVLAQTPDQIDKHMRQGPGGGGDGGAQRGPGGQGARPMQQQQHDRAANPERRQDNAPMRQNAQQNNRPGSRINRAEEQRPPRQPNGLPERQRDGNPAQGGGTRRMANPDQVNPSGNAQTREDRKNRVTGAGDERRRQNGNRAKEDNVRDNNSRRDDESVPRRLGGDDNRIRPRDNVPADMNRRNADPDAVRRTGSGTPRLDNRRPDNRNVDDRNANDRNPDNRNPNDRNIGQRDDVRRNDRRIGPAGAAAVGVGVGLGLGGGFLAPTGARRLDDLRRDRREVREGDSTFIREPGRTIVQERGRTFIVHDENDRFRALGLDIRRERRGNEFVDTINRPGGDQILTFTDVTGRLLRRVRRTRDGREIVLIDNGRGGRLQRYEDDVIVLSPPPMRIPRDRYIVDYGRADVGLLYETLIAPPLAPPPRRYTLDQIRYSPDVRNYLRSVDINSINFDTGSWDVPASATRQLEALATAIKRAIEKEPNSVFLVEGYTDAVGNADDNLSLSDRRAQSVAEILTKDFGVPPENLTTQGYGEQNLKEDTQGPSAANRRVVVRNITQILASGGEPPVER